MRRSTLIRRPALVLTAVLALTGFADPTATAAGPAVTTTMGAGPPVTDPATLCVMAFADANADGARDPGEAAMSNWRVVVKDMGGRTVGSIVTDSAMPACINLAAGTYVVAERLQPAWLATTSGEAIQTVTLVSAAATIVTFGNHRCCTTFTFRAGRADSFSVADGARAEPVTPVSATATPMYFDETRGNRALAHRFHLGTANCVGSASLRMRLRALPGRSANDTLRLRVPGGSSWSSRIEAIPPAGAWVSSPSRWTAKTVVLDLARLPVGAGTSNLLASVNATHVLDAIVQDDTAVDYIRLDVAFRTCPP